MKRAIIIAAMLAAAGLAGAQMFAQMFGAAGRLPAGYLECDYLESSGTQYIDTGLSVVGRRWTVDCAFLSASNPFMGAIVNNSGTYYRCHSTGNAVAIGFALGSAFPSISGNPLDRHTYAADATLGTSIDAGSWTAPVGTLPNTEIWLFARHGVGIANSYVSARVYSSAIAEAGTGGAIVQNLVPALDESGIPCMFDLVTSAPFYNAGTGTFAYKLKE